MVTVERNDEFDQPLMLLGPQRERPRLSEVLARWSLDGPVALAAPGWEEDEVDDAWVRDAVRRPVVNLKLYELADRLFAEDPEVLRLLRERQDELRRLREVNQLQLDHSLAVARALLQRAGSGESVSPQLESTFRHLGEIDADYLELVTEVIRAYDKRIDPWARPSVQRYRQRVLDRCQSCVALLIAGGHVGVLLNRLNLSRLIRYVQVPTIAWSGGAMAMAERVVFFHQHLPQATRDAEVSRRGLSWISSAVLFPRPAERLELANRTELALLARRFRGDACLLLDQDSEMEWAEQRWVRAQGVQRLTADGAVVEWQP